MSTTSQTLLLQAIQVGYAATLAPAYRRFHQAINDPLAMQEKMLLETVGKNRNTGYGRAHKFDTLQSIRRFQDTVPIVDYDAITPWIDRIAKGDQNVLTAEPVRMLERTSGSTGKNKLIPYTQGLLDQFSQATYAWQFDLFMHRPKSIGTRSYWSVSPSFQGEKTTEGGLPIGFEDDTEYFNPALRWALNKCLAVPASVKQIADWHQWKLQTALHLIGTDNLGIISVWSPTFIINLLQFFASHTAEILQQLDKNSRDRLDASLASGVCNAETLWPKLQLLSCWNDGVSSQFTPALRRHFPHTLIQGKGLLATEGVITFPLLNHASAVDAENTLHGGVAAVTSHFFEFLSVERPQDRPLLLNELRTGGLYSPIITTAGGLYRYHLKDVVKCTGYLGRVPLLEFVGKYDRVSDVCGEKLNASLLETHLQTAKKELNISADFTLLAPCIGTPSHYTLFVESAADNDNLASLAGRLESLLCESHHYRYARDIGQLSPLSWCRVEKGWATYQATLLSSGARLGDIKPTSLDARFDWHGIFRAE